MRRFHWVGKLPDGNCWMTRTSIWISPPASRLPRLTPISLADRLPKANTTTGNSFSSYNSDTGKSHDPGNEYYENTSGSDSHYHVGNCYQWSAATADYGSDRYNNADRSICPKGWTLPSQTQFQALIDSGLTRSNFMKAPYYLVRGGSFSYYTDSSSHAGSEGYYRSSTPNRNNTFKYFLTFSSSNMEVDSGWDYGYFSVRCVAAG